MYFTACVPAQLAPYYTFIVCHLLVHTYTRPNVRQEKELSAKATTHSGAALTSKGSERSAICQFNAETYQLQSASAVALS